MLLNRSVLTFLIFSLCLGVLPNAISYSNFGLYSNIYLFDIAMFLAFLISLFLRKHRIKYLDALFLAVFFFLFILNLLNTKYLFEISSIFYLLRLTIYSLSYPFFIFINRKFDLYNILKWVMLISVPAYLIIFIVFPNITLASFDPHIFRLYGMFLDPNYYSVLLCVLFFYLISSQCNLALGLKFVYSVLIVASIFLTFSRLGVLLFLFGCVFYLIKRRDAAFLGVLVGFVMLVLVNLRYLLRFTFFSGHFHSFFFKIVSFFEGAHLYNLLYLPVGFNNIRVYRYYLMSNTNNVSTYFDFFPFTILLSGGLVLLFVTVFYQIFISVNGVGHAKFALFCILLSSFVMNVFFNPIFFVLVIVLSVLALDNKKSNRSFQNTQLFH